MDPSTALFYEKTRSGRKLLVVDLGFLGDTIHLVPALWDIKRAYPDASLNVVTSRVGAEVLQMAPCVDRCWGVEMHKDKRTLGQQWQILRQLRKERFDAAFNFSGADRTLFWSALSAARVRMGYPGGRSHFWNRWLVPLWTCRQDPDLTVYKRHRQVLADCGVPLGEPCFELQLAASDVAWAASAVPEFSIHISVNASKPSREWPLEHHAELLRSLWTTHPTLVVVVSSSARAREQERLKALSAVVQDPRLKTLPETLTIPRLAAALKRTRLHIGPDSGVLHLAFALGVPTISFFREQGHYRAFLPEGKSHHTIVVPCTCPDERTSPCERLRRSECFAQIKPRRVANLVRQELDSLRDSLQPP